MAPTPPVSRPDPYDHPRDFGDVIAPVDIGGLLRVLWRGKWLMIWVLLITIGVAGYYAFRIAAPQYSAAATLPMDTGPAAPHDTAALNTSAARVTSDAVLTAVIAVGDLQADPEFNRYLQPQNTYSINHLRRQIRHWLAGTTDGPRDAAMVLDKTIQNLRGQLSVNRVNDTYILQITARSGNPDKAVWLVNTTATQYLAHIATGQIQAYQQTEDLLLARLADLRRQLDTQEQAAAALIAAAQIQGNGGLDALTAQVLATEQDLSEAQNALRQRAGDTSTGNARNSAEISQLRGKINDLMALRDRRAAQLSAQSAGQAALRQINRETEATRLAYQDLNAQLQDIRLQKNLRAAREEQFAPATEGIYAGPQKILILIIAAILGSGLGVLAVAFRHHTRKGIIDAQSLRDATGLPVLAQFTQRSMRQFHKITEHAQTGRRLHSALALTPQGRNAQVILSTASIAHEGKTTQALLLAQTLGLAGKRVLLIGADTSNLTLRMRIGAAAFDAAECAWRKDAPAAQAAALGCDILVIQDTKQHDAPLLQPHLSQRLTQLREIYDYIVIDGPCVLLAPEARLLAQHADAVIYAVRWCKTPRDMVLRGLAALEDSNCPATGLVLSRINPRKMRRWSSDPYIGAIAAT